jgi:predicted PurR-regulated permease PerM
MAFKNLKKHFIRFLKHHPGKRFQHYYHLINRRINHNIYIKILLTIIALISFLIGFVLLFMPGPGMLFILVSAILFCLISHRLAVFFDRLEEKIRQWKT